MNSKRESSDLEKKFRELNFIQEKKPQYQIILDKYETMNTSPIERGYNISLDNSTENITP